MSSKDSRLYGVGKQRNLSNGREISSSTTLSFTSQLSSLIHASSSKSSSTPSSGRSRPKKEDIFATHNRNSAKRAKRDLEPDKAGAFEQKHTTNGEALDKGVWERSKRKMEEKARLYAAMKRGDIEDADDKYAVDFDAKWAASRAEGKEDAEDDDDYSAAEDEEQIEYVDELGRNRVGTRMDALRAKQLIEWEANERSSRPAAPANVIYGDTIQHEAFNPDEPIAAQMEDLAKKRDKSLTPPPEEHFDSAKEIRTKGTAFFQFSGDAKERKQQMENLEKARAETERRRAEKESKMNERKAQIEARRNEVRRRGAKRKADEFLADLGLHMGAQGNAGSEEGNNMTARIEAAMQGEAESIE